MRKLPLTILLMLTVMLTACAVETPAIETEVYELKEQIASLSTQLTENEGQIASLNTQLSERQATITDLETQLGEKSKRISALEQRVAELEVPTPVPVTKPTCKAELIGFLSTNFSFLQTSLGPTNFTFDIYENTSITSLYDYWIKVRYDSTFFFDLKYNNDVTTEMNHTVCQELKNHQERLARAAIGAMPDKKMKGGYFDSWYEYPALKVGYISRHYYSWTNHEDSEGSLASTFRWDSLIDDDLIR